jgi:hypothetical protein
MLRIQTERHLEKEQGRLTLWNGQKVVFSKHYRSFKHREQIIEEIGKILLTKLF